MAIIPVPYYMPDGETWDGKLITGTNLAIDPEHFLRLRSTEISTCWNTTPPL
jgi:hypothetical protein